MSVKIPLAPLRTLVSDQPCQLFYPALDWQNVHCSALPRGEIDILDGFTPEQYISLYREL
jgi:hypothetical protein